MPKVKALVLMSGGLDSMLTARVLMEQGIEVIGLVFVSHFFGAQKARKAAEQLGVELREIDFKKEHLEMVKNPKYGYGKNMNPCIDCHSLMIRQAKKILEDEGFDFVATGEILGQRPMSQNKEALDIVEKYSGIGDLLVRPMSAKILKETRPEKEGKLIREQLLDIQGRSRAKQRELVKKFGIKEYASPGGGCLLTDPAFSQRLVKMFECCGKCAGEDIELLKHGRVFWVGGEGKKVLLVVGRDEGEDETIKKLVKKGDVLIELKDEVGPTAVLRGLKIGESEELEIDIPNALKIGELRMEEEKNPEEILNIAGLLTGYYATKSRGKKTKIKINLIK